jgi:hypothetical protein
MKHLFLAGACALALSGCVSLGLSQASSEKLYTDAAIAADLYLQSGHVTGTAAGQICLGDNANYRVLISTRNVADGVDYAPADNAHAAVQADGFKLNPVQCIPVAPK